MRVIDSSNLKAAYDKAARLRKQLDRLAALADSGDSYAERFISFLERLMDTEINSHSIGAGWLDEPKNMANFVRFCPNPGQFFRERQSASIARLVLTNPGLLASIKREDREQFIYDMLHKGDLQYVSWYRTALQAGTPNEVVARIILRMLRESDMPTGDSLSDSFIDEFRICCGMLGFVDKDKRVEDATIWRVHIDSPTMWSVMTDDQLFEAVRICEEKSPGIMLQTRHHNALYWILGAYVIGIQRSQAERRRNAPLLRQLLIEVCTRVPSLNDVVSTIFADLPTTIQRDLIERHRGCNYGVLLHTAVALDDRDMFEHYFGEQIAACNPFWAYHLTLRAADSNPGQTLLVRIRLKLEEYLLNHGFGFGVAQKNQNGGETIFVDIDGTRYVQADGPLCKAGEMVLVRTSGTVVSDQPIKTIVAEMHPAN